MTSTNRLLVASLLACLPFLNGNMVMYIEAPVGGGGPTATLVDDFDTDATGWAPRNGDITGCTQTETGSDGEITLTNTGICHYTGSTEGTQPTSENQWGILEYGVTQADFRGISLRAKSTTPTTEANYAGRCTKPVLHIRSCNEDSTCATIASGGTCANSVGDQLAFAVDGTGDGTELCVWFWAAAGALSIADMADPTSWGNADFCTSSDGLIDNANMTAIAGTPGAIEDWDTGTSTGPDDAGRFGFPAAGQMDVGIYSGQSGTTWTVEHFAAGDLD